MLNVQSVDRSPLHLYFPFLGRLNQLLDTMRRRTGIAWVIEEGWRSQGRQDWLYGQGRTHAPWKVVTWLRSPKWHGTGLAADVRPATGYGCPRAWWDWLYVEEVKLGLCDPPRSMGDLGHVQWDPADLRTRQLALAWVRAGFPQPHVAPVRPVGPQWDVRVIVNGWEMPDALAFPDPVAKQNRVAVRPVAEHLGWMIQTVGPDYVTVLNEDGPQLGDADDRKPATVRQAQIPCVFRAVNGEPRGFVWAADLRQLGATVAWDGGLKTVTISD